MNYEVKIIFFFILIYISTSIFLWDACSILSTQIRPLKDHHHGTNFKRWLKSFVARDKRFQDFCVQALTNNIASSQFSQDMWIFNNLFKSYTLQNKKGFYVDSGANDWKELSNTFFFDVCLGWDGLCVEPEKEYHSGLKEFRSCKLVTDCISDRKHKMGFVSEGVGSHITDGDQVSCDTLASMLGNRTKIDLWSLDVEKHELEVLKTVDFEKIEVSVLLVEDFWLPVGHLDTLLLNGQTGFFKLTQFPIDSVFVHRNFLTESPTVGKYWYPDNWQTYVDMNRNFRSEMVQSNKLTC